LVRHAPVILLIEDDEADRMTLARLLRRCGYSVMAARRGAEANNTFVIHHLHISLVLVSSRLSEFGRALVFDALSRIDARVPIVMATRYAPRRISPGEDPRGSLVFAELIAEVENRLQGAPAPFGPSAPRDEVTAVDEGVVFAAAPTVRLSSGSRGSFNWPLRNEDIDEVEFAEAVGDRSVVDEGFDEGTLLRQAGPPRRNLKSISSPELRHYLARLSRERRIRRHRMSLIGMTVAAGSALVITVLLEMRTSTARAITQEVVSPLLPSAPISKRVGIVHLVSAEQVNRSSLADDIVSTLRTNAVPPAANPAERTRATRGRR
jgi:CheY-like chemotaxis protein